MELDLNIKNKISELPKEIQIRIYIHTWRQFWRDYVPLTAKIPSWQERHNRVQQILWDARLKNIHFLHLPFNTLPENKKWIMGCQCDSCINDNKISSIEKYCHYLIQYRNSNYFTDKVIPIETSSSWNEYLIYYCKSFEDDIVLLGKNYDPLCGSYKENKFSKKLREGTPFKFSTYYS